MRQHIVEERFIEERVPKRIRVLEKYKKRLAKPEELEPEVRMNASEGVYTNILWRLLPLKYTRGDSIGSFAPHVDDMLTYRRLQNDYADALPEAEQGARVQWETLTEARLDGGIYWMAWALCLGRDKAYIREAIDLLDNAGLDALFDRIMVAMGDGERSVSNTRLYPKTYIYGMLDIMNASPTDRPRLMKTYVEGWYDGNKDAGWHDIHKINEEGYTGYWCWEAALLVKLYHIDDSAFRSHPHYPADLVRGV